MDSQTIVICFIILIGLLYGGMAYLWWELYRIKGLAKSKPSNSIVHLGIGMEPIKELCLAGMNGFVIGKGSSGVKPDFDLGLGESADTVGSHHAVMNLVEGAWYIEALENQCPVGMKKAGESVVYRLKTWTPYMVEPGDIIFIARERLLFK